jgi:hypothetical protein
MHAMPCIHLKEPYVHSKEPNIQVEETMPSGPQTGRRGVNAVARLPSKSCALHMCAVRERTYASSWVVTMLALACRVLCITYLCSSWEDTRKFVSGFNARWYAKKFKTHLKFSAFAERRAIFACMSVYLCMYVCLFMYAYINMSVYLCMHRSRRWNHDGNWQQMVVVCVAVSVWACVSRDVCLSMSVGQSQTDTATHTTIRQTQRVCVSRDVCLSM